MTDNGVRPFNGLSSVERCCPLSFSGCPLNGSPRIPGNQLAFSAQQS
jgi:hypothetical protein